MDNQFINLTCENINEEHICCLMRKKEHPGIEVKKAWLKERMQEGHVFRKLNKKATVFIEYAPLEKAWVPIVGDNYVYIYCLWVLGDEKNKGYGQALMEYCIHDAKIKGKSGICMLGAKKQKAWLSDQSFAKKYGFQVVDETKSGYQLLALSFDETKPMFASKVKKEKIDQQELTIYFDDQCPYINPTLTKIKQYCLDEKIPLSLVHINSLQQAKELPCVFNNYAVFCKGQLQTVNLLDVITLKRILKKEQ